jgi:hypothetical protein
MRWVAAILALGWAAALEAREAPAPARLAPRDHLRDILSRPLYSRWRLRTDQAVEPENAESGRLRRLVDEWLEWLRRRAEQQFPETSSRSGSGGGGSSSLPDLLRLFGYGILGVVVVFLAYLAFRVIRESRDRGRLARVLSREQVREALAAGDALALGSPEWLAEADRLAREGDFRAVYRALYLALLAGLHARSRIDFRRNRTNWIYVRGFRGPAELKATFASLTDLFDRVWYGLEAAAGASLDGIRRQMVSLVAGEETHG